MNIFHAVRHESAEDQHKRTASRLFYAPHVAKRSSKRSALVYFYKGIEMYTYIIKTQLLLCVCVCVFVCLFVCPHCIKETEE